MKTSNLVSWIVFIFSAMFLVLIPYPRPIFVQYLIVLILIVGAISASNIFVYLLGYSRRVYIALFLASAAAIGIIMAGILFPLPSLIEAMWSAVSILTIMMVMAAGIYSFRYFIWRSRNKCEKAT